MTTAYVLDASVVLKYFAEGAERHSEQAEELLAARDRGTVRFAAPRFLELEVFNVLGRKRGLNQAGLEVVAAALVDLCIEFVEVAPRDTIRWIERGLTSYDATYIVAAKSRNLRLVTDDDQIVALAPDIAIPLASIST